MEETEPSDAEIRVPARLAKPHPFLGATRDAAVGLASEPDGRLDIGRKEGLLHLQVSRALISRALRIAQAAFNEAERRGWGIEPVEKSYNHAAGVAIVVKTKDSEFSPVYAMKLYELRDRVPLTEAEIAAWMKHWHYVPDSPFNRDPPEFRQVANERERIISAARWASHKRSWGAIRPKGFAIRSPSTRSST